AGQQRAEFDLLLATGDVAGAWAIGPALLRHHPGDVQLLKQLAQLAEWNQQPRRALDYWRHLLTLREDAAERGHAWRLALQLFDYEQAAMLLAPPGAGRLGDREL